MPDPRFPPEEIRRLADIYCAMQFGEDWPLFEDSARRAAIDAQMTAAELALRWQAALAQLRMPSTAQQEDQDHG